MSITCPTLPRSEIVKHLADSHIININEGDFSNPTSAFVSDLYIALLARIGFLKDDHTQVDFAALERFDNLDAHSDSIQVMNLFSKIKQALAAFQSPLNFTLGDLIRPETQRTLKFVCVILNFFMHYEVVMSEVTECMESQDVLDEQRIEYEKKVSQLNAEISVCNDDREKDAPLVHELDAKVKDLEHTIRNLNSEQSSLRTTLRKLQEKAKEMKEKISKAEFELVQSVQENASLQSKRVQSPEKIQKALHQKKALLEEAKNFEKSTVKEFEDKSAAYDVHLKASKKMSKHLARMQALQEQVTSAKSIEKNVKQLKSKVTDDQLQERSLQAKVVELQGADHQLNENKKQVEKERDLKCEAYLRELDNVKLDVESRTGDLERKGKEIEAVLAKMDSVTLKINSCKKLGEEKQQEMLSKGEMIVSEMNKYMAKIEGIWQNSPLVTSDE